MKNRYIKKGFPQIAKRKIHRIIKLKRKAKVTPLLHQSECYRISGRSKTCTSRLGQLCLIKLRLRGKIDNKASFSTFFYENFFPDICRNIVIIRRNDRPNNDNFNLSFSVTVKRDFFNISARCADGLLARSKLITSALEHFLTFQRWRTRIMEGLSDSTAVCTIRYDRKAVVLMRTKGHISPPPDFHGLN